MLKIRRRVKIDKGVSLVSLIITIVVIMVLTCVIIFQEHTLSDASVLVGSLTSIRSFIFFLHIFILVNNEINLLNIFRINYVFMIYSHLYILYIKIF